MAMGGGGTYQPAPAISRLGISAYQYDTECLHGIQALDTTAFPQSLGLAASFRLISVTKLESLLHCCEHEPAWLDVTVNFKKSCCLRIGPRCDIDSCAITTLTGVKLSRVAELRYLGIFLVNPEA